jgi:hypothetical protein
MSQGCESNLRTGEALTQLARFLANGLLQVGNVDLWLGGGNSRRFEN